MALHPVILAGGSGTRLWPMSRQHYPKQFLPLAGQLTMIQETLRRLDGIEGVAAPIFVCNEQHRFLVMEQASQVGVKPSEVILEPVGRNTAPALALAALALLDGKGAIASDPVMLAMPADHVIGDLGVFRAAAKAGESLARCGRLVTLGVVPTAPVTGYGYIRKGERIEPSALGEAESADTPSLSDVSSAAGNIAPYRVSAFVEKPDEATARAYADSGEYLWNSGIFIVGASVWLRELARYRPDVEQACRIAYSRGALHGQFYRPDKRAFIDCPSDSIDYAVMEKAAGLPEGGESAASGESPSSTDEAADCVVLPLDAGWSDLGSWSSVWEVGERDEHGNVVRGDVCAHGVEDALLLANHRLLAAVGLSDVIVVETPDAVLVAHKDRAQEVRDLVSRLAADRRPEYENHREVHCPWGTYDVIDGGSGFQVKRLKVNPGAALSLQTHQHRAEHWVVVRGAARVTRGDEVFLLGENQSTYVPKQAVHRLENRGTDVLEIIEVQLGTYLGEDDIVRYDDRYDRQGGT